LGCCFAAFAIHAAKSDAAHGEFAVRRGCRASTPPVVLEITFRMEKSAKAACKTEERAVQRGEVSPCFPQQASVLAVSSKYF
jgi:hypothetical protein